MNRPNPVFSDIDNILNNIGDPFHTKPILNEIRPTLPDAETNAKPTPLTNEEKEAIANYQKVKGDLEKWNNTFTNKSPQDVLSDLNAKPAGTLTADQREAINNYLQVKSALDAWTSIFGTEKAQSIKDKLDAKPTNTNNQVPDDLPPTWREQLRLLDELKKRPTEEQLKKAVQDEKDKYKDYQTIKDNLKTWTDIFGTETAKEVKVRLDAITPPLSDNEKEAIKNYPKLKTDYDNLKTSKDKKIGELEQQIKIKNAEIDKLKGWANRPSPNNLVDQVNQKIIQAYNSTEYLNGYYEKLMKQFLNWEVAGTEEQKKALLKTKENINKCLTFLDSIAQIKDPRPSSLS